MKKSIALISILCLLFIDSSVSYAQIMSNTTIANEGSSIDKSKSSKSLWPENEPSVNSQAAIVMEASTGAILYSKNIHEQHYPASITKILTALLALENSSLGETVTFSKEAIYDVDLDSSRIGIDVGEKLTMEQCLYGIMLESANEVSYAIAEHISGSVESFSELMNKKAAELGCTDSNFVNPHGLPEPNHYTSVYDMALIARAAINNDTFRQITGTRTYAIPPTNIQDETRYLANHHKFIKGNIDFDGAIGGKTGYTSLAKYTLVSFAERNGITLISVIMYCDSIDHEYADTASLLNYGFDNFSIYNIAEMEDPDTVDSTPLFSKYSPLFSRAASQLQISPIGNIVLPNSASYEDAKKEVVLTPVSEIAEGENVIGSIKYTYDGNYVGSADIIYNNTVSASLLKSFIPSSSAASDARKSGAEGQSVTSNNLKPIIIGIIIGCIVLALGLYIIFVEIPFRRKRNSYLEKKKHKKSYRKNDLDF